MFVQYFPANEAKGGEDPDTSERLYHHLLFLLVRVSRFCEPTLNWYAIFLGESIRETASDRFGKHGGMRGAGQSHKIPNLRAGFERDAGPDGRGRKEPTGTRHVCVRHAW